MVQENFSPKKYDKWSAENPASPHFSVEPRTALIRALEYTIQCDAYQGEKMVGDYLVAYMVEPAKWLRYTEDSGPVWKEPRDENAHIAIAVHDAADLHMIADCTVTVTVLDENGYPLGTEIHPYLRRPRLHHYGKNWNLPGDGSYRIHIHIEPPKLMQYSETRGFHYLEPANVDFEHVVIKTGHNIS